MTNQEAITDLFIMTKMVTIMTSMTSKIDMPFNHLYRVLFQQQKISPDQAMSKVYSRHFSMSIITRPKEESMVSLISNNLWILLMNKIREEIPLNLLEHSTKDLG